MMAVEVWPRLVAFGQACIEPVQALVDPSKRLFWPYLASAAAMAAGVWALRVRRAGRTSLAGFLLARGVWLHPSARLDYRFLFARAALGALLVGPALLSAQGIAVSLALGLTRALGPGPLADVRRAWVIGVFTVVAFVLRDFLRFLAHLASHRSGALWEIHKVHHSAEVLTPFTLNRTHPLEGLLMRAASALGLGVAAGLCAWLFRGRVSAWEILGVDALSFAWTLAGSNLRHSHVWLSFGPAVEHVLLSPAQHQIHHSIDPKHHGRNLGEAIALWDWLFGTLYVTRGREKLVFGLDPGEQNHGPTVASMLLAPPLASLRALLGRGSRG